MIFVRNNAQKLSIERSDKPSINDDEVLIEVFAAGINRPDIFQKYGLYNPPSDASEILGLEVSGVIVAKGKHVNNLSIGSKVMALVNGGGYAQFCKASQLTVLPLPENWSFYEGAAFPEVFFTVWKNIVNCAKIKAGDIFLIHAGASGIGVGAIQLALHLGAKVITTVGSEEKQEFCLKLKPHLVINRCVDDFVKVIQEYTGKKGVDVILDIVGGDYLQKNIRVAAPNACIVNIASLQNPVSEITLFHLMRKRITLTGSTLRACSDTEKGYICRAIYKNLWSFMQNKTIVPIIDSIFPVQDVEKAHKHMESNTHMGKIVLALDNL